MTICQAFIVMHLFWLSRNMSRLTVNHLAFSNIYQYLAIALMHDITEWRIASHMDICQAWCWSCWSRDICQDYGATIDDDSYTCEQNVDGNHISPAYQYTARSILTYLHICGNYLHNISIIVHRNWVKGSFKRQLKQVSFGIFLEWFHWVACTDILMQIVPHFWAIDTERLVTKSYRFSFLFTYKCNVIKWSLSIAWVWIQHLFEVNFTPKETTCLLKLSRVQLHADSSSSALVLIHFNKMICLVYEGMSGFL